MRRRDISLRVPLTGATLPEICGLSIKLARIRARRKHGHPSRLSSHLRARRRPTATCASLTAGAAAASYLVNGSAATDDDEMRNEWDANGNSARGESPVERRSPARCCSRSRCYARVQDRSRISSKRKKKKKNNNARKSVVSAGTSEKPRFSLPPARKAVFPSPDKVSPVETCRLTAADRGHEKRNVLRAKRNGKLKNRIRISPCNKAVHSTTHYRTS